MARNLIKICLMFTVCFVFISVNAIASSSSSSVTTTVIVTKTEYIPQDPQSVKINSIAKILFDYDTGTDRLSEVDPSLSVGISYKSENAPDLIERFEIDVSKVITVIMWVIGIGMVIIAVLFGMFILRTKKDDEAIWKESNEEWMNQDSL